MEERKKSNDSSVRKSNQVKLHDGEKMALRRKPHHDEEEKGHSEESRFTSFLTKSQEKCNRLIETFC